MVYVGIDPGKKGAMAIIYEDGTHRQFVFDEDKYLYELLALDKYHTKCVVENVHAMPGDGRSGAFTFGNNFGYIRGILKACRIPYELVAPQKWKKEFSVTADKNTSIEVADRLFPGTDFRATERSKKPHDGICEALLIAEYGRRNL